MDSTQENLESICTQISEALSSPIDPDNGDEIRAKLNDLTNIMATSSHAVALSQQIYANKIMTLTEDNQYSKLSATDKKNIFAGRARKEGYYVDLCERQSRSISHAIDALRSMLSYLKQEMQNLPTN